MSIDNKWLNKFVLAFKRFRVPSYKCISFFNNNQHTKKQTNACLLMDLNGSRKIEGQQQWRNKYLKKHQILVSENLQNSTFVFLTLKKKKKKMSRKKTSVFRYFFVFWFIYFNIFSTPSTFLNIAELTVTKKKKWIKETYTDTPYASATA